MFNMIITGKCSKNCSFCFTEEEARKESKYDEMSLDYIKGIVERYEYKKRGHVLKLLGGEPTEHSHFTDIIEYAAREGVPVYLISNFLFGQKIQECILDNLGIFTSFLVNGAELAEKNRLKLFAKNFNKIAYEFGKQKPGNKKHFTLAQTIPDTNYEIINFTEYLKHLKRELDFSNLGNIRIGLGLSGTYLLNNKKVGEKVAEILRFNRANRLGTQFDCQFPPCIFTDEQFEEFETPSFSLWNSVTANPDAKTFPGGICHMPAFDLMPDETLLYCYQTQAAISPKLPEIEQTMGQEELSGTFIGKLGAGLDHVVSQRLRADYLIEREKHATPDACKQCHLFPQYCGSLCLGCHM